MFMDLSIYTTPALQLHVAVDVTLDSYVHRKAQPTVTINVPTSANVLSMVGVLDAALNFPSSRMFMHTGNQHSMFAQP